MQPIIQGTLNNPTTTTADTPQSTPSPTPEALVDQLRAIRTQLPETTPLTAKQRKAMKKRVQTPDGVLQASINVIGVSNVVASAVGQPLDNVRSLQDESNRWSAVEDELKALLNGVSDANLIRKDRLALIAAQAYGVGAQLARDPANVLVAPHVKEIKRLRKAASRKKPQPTTPENPAPTQTTSAQQQHTIDAPKVEA
jgi:crotonobetainyl-CoA:carnitine CoA-transferase CaiB-like acyl-CoA transferase